MKISNVIDIQATREEVFHWLDDPERSKEWMTSVTKTEILNKTPNRIGTTFREYIEENGRGIEMSGIVTEFVSNERFAVHLESDINLVDVRFTLIEQGSVTQLRQDAILRFKGIMNVLSIFLRATIKKNITTQTQKEFAKLKELCEPEG